MDAWKNGQKATGGEGRGEVNNKQSEGTKAARRMTRGADHSHIIGEGPYD